jgi:hypothetical protein
MDNYLLNNSDITSDKFHFYNFLAETVPESKLQEKGVTRQQLLGYLLTSTTRIICCEQTQTPYVGSASIATLNPTYNIYLPNISFIPLFTHPFLFGPALEGLTDNHRTATGALAELMFFPETLDESIGEEVYLFVSIAIGHYGPSRLAIKRAKQGETTDFELVREL